LFKKEFTEELKPEYEELKKIVADNSKKESIYHNVEPF